MRRDEFRYRPALTRAESEQTRRSREALLDGGLLTAPPGSTGVPREIETSWRRCVGEAVPVAPERLDYREPDDELPALRRAAEPLFERLKDSFADVPVAMVLSDATGRIILRHTDVRRQRETMDRAGAAEGFDYSEQSVGTNGLGTVLVERRPVLVRGPEHYNARLEDLTCAGTPVVEPFTGRMVGSFSLACSMRDVHPLMTVMTGDIGRQLESRMLEEAGDRRRRLVRAFLTVDRTAAGALVVDEETVLANRLGLAHTGPELHPLLWRFLSEHGPAVVPRRMEVPLADGRHDAMVEPIHEGGRTAFSIRLVPGRPDRRPSPPARRAAVPPAASLHHDPDVDRRLADVVRFAETVALTGPSGTGKRHTAVRVLSRRGADDPLVVEPHLDPDWFGAARAAAGAGRGVVVRRVHRAPSPTAEQLQALDGAPLALTGDLDDADDEVLGAVRQVATTVRLPTLAQSREHLPVLVRSVLADLPAPRFGTAVWDRLMDWHWPGNVAELRTTVVALARRADGGTVEVEDLPDELRTPRRAMGRMESAERDAVAEALRDADGNRSRAAQSLGIGRNTLYRKMREFGIS